MIFGLVKKFESQVLFNTIRCLISTLSGTETTFNPFLQYIQITISISTTSITLTNKLACKLKLIDSIIIGLILYRLQWSGGPLPTLPHYGCINNNNIK